MRVMMLGGTGAMGACLTELLASRGVQVTVTSRRPRKGGQNVEVLIGNALEEDFLTSVLKEGWDVVVDFMVYSTSHFQRRVERLLNSTSQYIYLSSARVYAPSEKPIKEDSLRLLDASRDTEYLSTDEYALAKARQENILASSPSKNWTIVRPYITYGPERLQLGVLEKEAWLYRALRGRTIVIPEEILEKRTTLTYGGDVAGAIAALIGLQKAIGETYHITSPRDIAWKEVLEVYLEVMKQHGVGEPRYLSQDTSSFLGWFQNRYQLTLDRLVDRKFDNSKIGEIVNIYNFDDTRAGLRRCLSDFLRCPTFLAIDWRAEVIKDKQTKEWARIAEFGGVREGTRYALARCGLI